MTTWQPDVLGDGYVQHVIELGPDPDGEGDVRAVLVKREPLDGETVRGTVLYVHGFSDYFFQREMADFLAERGFAFYALDLRKCGRSRRPGQTGHYVSDLSLYDAELDEAVRLVAEENPGTRTLLVAHSTGGLILPLWLDRRNRQRGGNDDVSGLVLNSPWFDLQGSAVLRGPVTQALRMGAKARPFAVLKLPPSQYGHSLHREHHGIWDFDVALKPLEGCPVTIGWLNAVRRGHARLHRGLEVGVPSLVLRSDTTYFSSRYSERIDTADAVLDVRQIARWAGCLGGRTSVVPVPQARHDVFLSLDEPRKRAYAELDAWLSASGLPA